MIPLLLLLWTTFAASQPVFPTDNFISPCSFISDPPPSGFQLWSDPSTWGGVVPGVGAAVGVDVTIPCDKAVLMNVPFLELGLLRIQGFLKFLDDPSLPSIYVRANHILVEGQLTIGTETAQFNGSVAIELTASATRANLLFTSNPPASTTYPRNLGQKAFAVVGGQVHLHGIPGPSGMPVWCRLAQTANVGDRFLQLDCLTSWAVGSEIVIASTDFNRYQAEVFRITDVSTTSLGTLLGLDKPLINMHYGDPAGLPDGFGGLLNQCAEVGLLTRNIAVNATKEASPFNLIGGHFMIFHTQIPQYVEGVAFSGMGQQGVLGRYPIHFHLAGNQERSVVRKNSIRDSNQRCIVVHATFNLTVEENVAYNTKGHCYMTEEGGEINTSFIRNLGIVTDPVSVLIPIEAFSGAMNETDDRPSTFWITNPSTNMINNSAAGSAESGIWYELRSTVRGISRAFALINSTQPRNVPLGKVTGNTAHSNVQFGIRTYPHGYFPKMNNVRAVATIYNFNSYKNGNAGIFAHNTDALTYDSATLADNRLGMFFSNVEGVTLQNSRVVGLSKNYGMPQNCNINSTWVKCRPVYGCSLPLARGDIGRSLSWQSSTHPYIGVQINQNRFGEPGILQNAVISTQFSAFNDTCTRATAIAITGDMKATYWNSGHYAQGLRFAPDVNLVYMPPQISSYTTGLTNAGEIANFYSFWDKDGSIMGSSGYIVANNPNILPPTAESCTFKPSWNAYACPGTCYRSISIEYTELSFFKNLTAAIDDFSSLIITRVQDGKVIQVYGNYQQEKPVYSDKPYQRFFFFNLLAGLSYTIEIKPSAKAPSFYPTSINVRYRDNLGCGQGLTLQFVPAANKQWTAIPTPSIFFKPCSGISEQVASPTSYYFTCSNGVSNLAVDLAPSLPFPFQFYATDTSTACNPNSECGLISMGSDNWKYNTSGLELRPGFYRPSYNDASWPSGLAPLGYRGYGNFVKTKLPLPTSSLVCYYLRKAFTLKDSSSITGLNVSLLPGDGAVIYINNRELLRYNMPSDYISNRTLALKFISNGDAPSSWANFTVNLDDSIAFLVDGKNSLAVEVHTFSTRTWQFTFDIRLSGILGSNYTTGQKASPEICDGIDNDGNGLIDEGADGLPLTRACVTNCGNGTETCIDGTWQSCTAPSTLTESCNGVDDDCDGFIDNGLNQLDCASGQACFQGSCQTITGLTVPEPVWGRNATGWNYFHHGGNLDVFNSDWRNGSLVTGWAVGNAPLGTDNVKSTFGTVTIPPPWSFTTYFRKSFDLAAADVLNTYTLSMNVRRDDGAVVYLNGQEIFRTNMPFVPINWTTLASSGTAAVGSWNSKYAYFPCTSCNRNTTSLLKEGTNFIAAQVHQNSIYSNDVAFDLDLTRNIFTPCSSLPGQPSSCIRSRGPYTFFPMKSSWSYADTTTDLPPSNWMSPSFNDSAWKTGIASFGFNASKPTTLIGGFVNGRVTTYFRKTFVVPDANCFFELSHTFQAYDGVITYINGVEVYRYNLRSDEDLSAKTLAISQGLWYAVQRNITAGYLRVGTNVMAVELHAFSTTTTYAFFDSQLVGRRDGACSPVI